VECDIFTSASEELAGVPSDDYMYEIVTSRTRRQSLHRHRVPQIVERKNKKMTATMTITIKIIKIIKIFELFFTVT
jgi:hypothetical protein